MDIKAKVIAKSAAAQLRVVVRIIEDRDTARVLYSEITQIAKTLEKKHRFGRRVLAK